MNNLDHTGAEFAATLGVSYDDLRRDHAVPPPDGVRGRQPVWTWPVVAKVCEVKGRDPVGSSPVLERAARTAINIAKYLPEARALRSVFARHFRK